MSTPISSTKPNVIPISVKWGLMTGLGIVVTHFLLHQAGLLPCALWAYSDFILLLLGYGMAMVMFKRQNEGYISLKCSLFLAGFLTLTAALCSRLYLLIELTYLDDFLLEHLEDELRLHLLEQGLTHQTLEKALAIQAPTAWEFVSTNFLLFVGVGLLLCSPLAFLMRKDPPPAFVVYDHT